MEKEIVLKIVSAAYDIGTSSKHFVGVSLATQQGSFPATVFIHELDDRGFSVGVVDSLDFSTDLSYELHRDWLQRWTDIVAKERDDDTHRLRRDSVRN